MTDLPEWILNLYIENRDKASRSNLKILLSKMAELLDSRDFLTIDTILSQVDWKQLSPEIIMAFLRTSVVARENLPSYSVALESSCNELASRGLPVEMIMMGLLK
jgi:hypothetical protein